MNRRILIADNDPNSVDLYLDILGEKKSGNESDQSGSDRFELYIFPDGNLLVQNFRSRYDHGERTPLCIFSISQKDDNIALLSKQLRMIDPDVGIIIILPPNAQNIRKQSAGSDIYIIERNFDKNMFKILVLSIITGWDQKQEYKDKVQRLELAMEGADIGLWDWNIQTDQLIINRQWAQMLGYYYEDIKPDISSWEDKVHPEDLPLAKKQLDAHLAWEAPFYEAEYRMKTKSGEWKWILARGQVVEWDADGQVLRIAGTHMDISDRKRFERELKRQRALLYSLIDSIPDLIYYKDLEGVYLGCNPAFGKFVGCHRRDVVGKTDYDLFSKNVADFFREQDRLMLISGQARSNVEWVDYPDGRHVPLDMLRTPYYGPYGEILGLVGIGRDITKQKQLEEELKKAKVAAEEASKAKSSFLASMSHEIRTPMSGIIGMTDLLKDTKLTKEQVEYLDIIRKSSDSLLAIINDILDISKIEAGKVELESIDFDLRETLEDMNDLMAIKAAEKSIEYVYLIDHDVPSRLKGDPGRLRQILINLIGNAIKFTSEGEVTLHVSCKGETELQAILGFSVKDTGIGIPAKHIDKLFDKFTQVDMSTTRKYGGTGLGLAISKQLCEMMGGQMTAQSEVGKGSIFRFTVVMEKQVDDGSSRLLPLEELMNRRILVVDDNASNRMVLKEQLLLWGCRFDEAPDGNEAIFKLKSAVLEGEPFDIAILDMEMPNMDGLELGKRIKEDEVIKDTRLIMMTSIGNRSDVDKFKSIGFSAYLVKPVKYSRLRECLLEVIGKKYPDLDHGNMNNKADSVISDKRKKDMRILLVEDNEIIQMVSLGLINKMGYEADLAENGKEAIKALEKKHYDLVLMDMEMPVMDGYEATAKIRAPGTTVLNPTVPIIAITAHAMKRELDRCIEAGMNAYLTKPVKHEELEKIIEQYVPEEREDTEKGDDKAIFDEFDVKKRLANNEKLIDMLLKVFMENTPVHIENLKKALREEDMDKIQDLCHTLKGTCATAGAVSMRDIARDIENSARAGESDNMALLMDKLQAEFEKYKDLLISKDLIRAQILAHEEETEKKEKESEESGDEPIDKEKVLEIVNGNEEILKKLLKDSINNSVEMLKNIEKAIKTQDSELLSKAAHKFKGTLRYLAADKGAKICSHLENMGKSGNLNGAKTAFDKLLKEYKRIRAFIQKILTSDL